MIEQLPPGNTSAPQEMSATPPSGGDFYSAFALEGGAGGVAIVIGDVAGHGPEQALQAEHLLIADDPQALADAVLRARTDAPLAAALSRQGRALVEREYGWAAITAQLEVFSRQILAGR